MSVVFIDTSALKWKYISGPETAGIDRIFSDASVEVFISELTILEWSRALATATREKKLTYEDYKKNELAFMTDIHARRPLVLSIPTRGIERARHIIDYVGVHLGKRIDTQDALHIVVAQELASSKQTSVRFVSCDQKLLRLLGQVDGFVGVFEAFDPCPIPRGDLALKSLLSKIIDAAEKKAFAAEVSEGDLREIKLLKDELERLIPEQQDRQRRLIESTFNKNVSISKARMAATKILQQLHGRYKDERVLEVFGFGQGA